MISEGFDSFHKDGVKSFNVLLPELMSNLLHNLPGIAYRCRNDSKWTMLFLSEGCYQLTGFNPGELLYNSELSYEDLIFEEDRSLVRESVNDAVQKRTQFQMTYRIKDRNGQIKWVWEQGNAIYDQHNNPFYLDGFITDVTARIKAEETLKENSLILSELNAMKDKFFTTIAHDLQNPIYAIISLSDFIYQNAAKFSKEDMADFLHQINVSAKSAHTLLENLLDWAKSQTGKLKIQKVRLNLPKLLDECISINGAHAHNKGVKIETDIPDQLYCNSDYHLLSTVFRNLISNAIKYSHINSTVIITAKAIDDKIEVEISDTGIGISRFNLNKLFQIDNEFHSLGTANEAGTGLGLILVKDFLDRLGGTVQVESKLKQGSIFTVRI